MALNNLQRFICHKTKQTKPTNSKRVPFFFFFFLSTSISTKKHGSYPTIFSSFLLFQPRQHSISLLLTSKGGKKIILCFHFLSNLGLLLCVILFPLPLDLSSFTFSIVRGYFIYLTIWPTIFLPQARFETESMNYPVYTTRHVKILHTFSLISHPLFPKYPLQHNVLVSHQPPEFLSNFSTPLKRETFTKPGMASIITQNIDFILGILH